jgi:Fur family transcriptional regulator, ferric uptake regulator
MAPDRITETAADRALRVVRASGGRLTSPTRTVVAVLASGDDHLTADDLITEVEARLPGVAPSTVYRVIQRLSELELIEHVHTSVGPPILSELELIERVHTSVGPPIYHLRESGHAHLVCNGCGTILDIADEHLDALQEALSREFGFTLAPHHSALVGYCKECDARAVGHSHRRDHAAPFTGP